MTIGIVLLAAALGALATFNRGCGFIGPAPDWLPRWLASDEYNAGEKHWSWGFRRWAKVVIAGVSASILARCATTGSWDLAVAIGEVLVGLATAGTFALGHSIAPGRDAPAYVLRLMDMAPGWQRGVWEGMISGMLLALPLAAWLAWSGMPQGALLALLGGALKPWCYWTGGLICSGRASCNPDNPASLLHGATSWGAVALAVLIAQ